MKRLSRKSDSICFCRTGANVPSAGITQAKRFKHDASCTRLWLLRPQRIYEAFQKVCWYNASTISTTLPVATHFKSNLDFAQNKQDGHESVLSPTCLFDSLQPVVPPNSSLTLQHVRSLTLSSNGPSPTPICICAAIDSNASGLEKYYAAVDLGQKLIRHR